MKSREDIKAHGGACAACRDQQRRCEPDCPLARYFPRHQKEDYQCTRRLFGLSRLSKICKLYEGPQRDQAMRSRIHDARMRRDNPISGTLDVIRSLEARIDAGTVELRNLRSQLQGPRLPWFLVEDLSKLDLSFLDSED